jgi:DegV family protein with EDD domain
MGIRIVTDSTADIGSEEAKKLGISVVPLKTVFEDGVYRDGIDMTAEEFYQKQASSKKLPTTTQPSPLEFEDVFREALEQGDSVIAIVISGVLSGTVQSADIAKQICGGDIYVIDSESTTIGLRIIVDLAVSLRDRGMSAADAAKIIEKEKKRVNLYAVVDTLEYLKKGGRLSKTAAFAGTLLDVKPIIYLREGELGVKSKVRGLRNAQKEILRMAAEDGIDLEMPFSIGYTGSPDVFESFRALADEQIGKKNPLISTIGSVIGTHVGPGAVAIAYFKK